MLKTFDIVTVKPDAADADIRKLRGHIVSAIEPDQIGVFIYGLERVFCVHPDDVIATGMHLPDDEQPNPARIVHVTSRGEVSDR